MQKTTGMHIKPDFTQNKSLAVNKSNAQHNELKTRMEIAKKSNALHFNQMNLSNILPEVSLDYQLPSHCLFPFYRFS